MVALVFRTAGVWGAGKGSNLTPAEVDGNFEAIKVALDAIEADPPTAVGISNITSTGSTFTVWLDDGSSFGPFALPTATPLIPVVTVAGSTYSLLLADRGSYLRMTAAGGCVVDVPSEAETAIPVGSEFYFRQAAAVPVTFDASTGVTINGVTGFDLMTAVTGAVAMLKKVATDEWDLCGMLAEVTA